MLMSIKDLLAHMVSLTRQPGMVSADLRYRTEVFVPSQLLTGSVGLSGPLPQAGLASDLTRAAGQWRTFFTQVKKSACPGGSTVFAVNCATPHL